MTQPIQSQQLPIPIEPSVREGSDLLSCVVATQPPRYTAQNLKAQPLPIRLQIFYQLISHIHQRDLAFPTQRDLEQLLTTFQASEAVPSSLGDELCSEESPSWVEQVVFRHSSQPQGLGGGKRRVHRVEATDDCESSFRAVVASPKKAKTNGRSGHLQKLLAHTVVPVCLTSAAKEADQRMLSFKLSRGRTGLPSIAGCIYMHPLGEGIFYFGQTKSSINDRSVKKAKDALELLPHNTVGMATRQRVRERGYLDTEVVTMVPYSWNIDAVEMTWILIADKIFGFETTNEARTFVPNDWLSAPDHAWPLLVEEFSILDSESESESSLLGAPAPVSTPPASPFRASSSPLLEVPHSDTEALLGKTKV